MKVSFGGDVMSLFLRLHDEFTHEEHTVQIKNLSLQLSPVFGSETPTDGDYILRRPSLSALGRDGLITQVYRVVERVLVQASFEVERSPNDGVGYATLTLFPYDQGATSPSPLHNFTFVQDGLTLPVFRLDGTGTQQISVDVEIDRSVLDEDPERISTFSSSVIFKPAKPIDPAKPPFSSSTLPVPQPPNVPPNGPPKPPTIPLEYLNFSIDIEEIIVTKERDDPDEVFVQAVVMKSDGTILSEDSKYEVVPGNRAASIKPAPGF